MVNMANTKLIISIVLIVVMILNITLFAFGSLNVGIFWLVIGVGALVTYVIFPKMRS